MKKTKTGDTMTYAVAINSSGQATIPKAVREFLGVIPGENCLTIDIIKGKVVLGREISRKEQFLASLDKIHKGIEKEKKRNPKFAEKFEKYKDMTYNEIMDLDDPEETKAIEEKYEIKL